MLTDIGEFMVGAHLRLVRECDFVDYNIRPPGGGLAGLEELAGGLLDRELSF